VVVKGGDILNDVINDYNNLDEKMAKMLTLENEGDQIIENLVRRLNTSFILPFDREDAFQLAQKMSATLDYITGIIDRMILYKAGEPNDRVIEMVEVLLESLQLQDKALNRLDRIDHNKKAILESCLKIRNLERKQDTLYRSGLADLFENQSDPIVIIKWREYMNRLKWLWITWKMLRN
jgi:predicted phosphate transport protein (TIGR00153 family)